MRRTAEFDAFGPWIDEVRAPEDVPRLYRSSGVDPTSAELVLKVPRRISRRDATPDMDLYDHLVVLSGDDLTLLTRRGSEFTRRTVRVDHVASITASVDLLDGRFSVADTRMSDPDEPLSFRYNSVSHELVEQLVRSLRDRARGGSPLHGAHAAPPEPVWGRPMTLGLRDLGEHDVALVTEQRDITDHDRAVVPIAMHPRTVVERRNGTFRGLLDQVWPVTLQAAIVSTGPDELHVIHRRRWFTTGRKPVTSVAHTVVLTSRTSGVNLRRSERYHKVRLARITSGRAVTSFPVPADSDTAAAIQGVVEASRRTNR
jgi:hypothetical protein